MVCEIRKPTSPGEEYELEIAAFDRQPQRHRFGSASELIDEYLRTQAHLIAQGWRPSFGDIHPLV